MSTIGPFTGKYRFLSNFWPCAVILGQFGTNVTMAFPSVEHAYQAAKSVDYRDRVLISNTSTPGAAKKLGKKLALRPDWDEIKLEVMESLLRQKFNDPGLKAALLATIPDELVELNYWGDTYWGVCKGVGSNNLGKLLMKIRSELC